MALDKLVDSTQLDADLTSVANAIRTKGGTSASLAFPAGFVSAIAAIPTGGGGVPIATGTLTPTSAMSSFSLSIDFEPICFVLFCDPSDLPNNSTWKISSLQMLIPNVFLYGAITRTNSGALQTQQTSGGSYTYSNGTFTAQNYAGYRSLEAGVTYTWYAMGAST